MLDAEFDALEQQMRSELASIRARFSHSGNKGASAEEVVRDFLGRYLPRRYAVGHGEVVDQSGGRSGQTDVVVANEEHPFTFSGDGPGLFFIEGVSAGGEIKSVLNGQELVSAIRGAERFKSLVAEIPPGAVWMGNSSDEKRFLERRPYFLLAFESELSPATIWRRLKEQAPGPYGLDGVFVLGKAALVNVGDGQGNLRFRSVDGEHLTGWQCQETQHILVEFLAWLYMTMPAFRLMRGFLPKYLTPGRIRTLPPLP